MIPRERAARGKRHTRARTETFATHVALEEMLERATPGTLTTASAAGDGAANTEPRGDSDGDPSDRDATPLRPRPTPAGSDAQADAPALPGRVPPSGTVLALAGAGAIALGGAAVFAFFRGGEAVLRPDAAPRRDASALLDVDAAPELTTAGAPIDAGDALDPPAPPDAAALDVRPIAPRPDAGVRLARPDAGESGDTPPRPTGTATLTIGANPWGNVLLDGKRIGRTPIEHLSVAAGRHVIEVIFGGEDPPRSLKYTVDLTDGEARDVLADFTKPPAP